MLGLPLGAIATPAIWSSALATSLAPSLLIAAAALAAAMLALRTTSVTAARTLSAVAMVATGLSLAVTGHAATAPPQWLTRTAMFVHGVGVAFWVGALLPLAAMVGEGTRRCFRSCSGFHASPCRLSRCCC